MEEQLFLVACRGAVGIHAQTRCSRVLRVKKLASTPSNVRGLGSIRWSPCSAKPGRTTTPKIQRAPTGRRLAAASLHVAEAERPRAGGRVDEFRLQDQLAVLDAHNLIGHLHDAEIVSREDEGGPDLLIDDFH